MFYTSNFNWKKSFILMLNCVKIKVNLNLKNAENRVSEGIK